MRLMRRLLPVLALSLSGCSGFSLNPVDWFGSKDTGPKMAELPVLSSAIQVRTLWQANSVRRAGGFSPAVAPAAYSRRHRTGPSRGLSRQRHAGLAREHRAGTVRRRGCR
jgi:hypothetical protein